MSVNLGPLTMAEKAAEYLYAGGITVDHGRLLLKNAGVQRHCWYCGCVVVTQAVTCARCCGPRKDRG